MLTPQPPTPGTHGEEQVLSPLGRSLPPIETGLVEIAPVLLGRMSRLWRLLSWVIGALGFVALVFAVVHFGSLERLIELVRSSRPAWLGLALLVQAATYVSAALVWRLALRDAGYPIPLRPLIPLGVAKLFTDQVLPSGGISGTMLVVRSLIRRRVPAEITMAAMLAGLLSYDVAYLTAALTGAGILWLHHRLNLPLLGGLAVFAVITIAVPASVFGLKRWGDHQPITWLSKLFGVTAFFRALVEAPTDLLRGPGVLVQLAGFQLGIFVLDALTLWLAFKAIGDVPAIWVVFVSFIAASIAATIGPIPVGLGTFEAGAIGMLSFLGVSLEAALAATVMLRGLTFWLPMLPGIWIVRREIGR